MKNFFRSARALIPWLSLAAPIFLFGILSVLKYLSPDLFCKPMDSGGKEFICGADYSHPGVFILQRFTLSAWVLLLAAGSVDVFRRRASWPAVITWSISALLFVGLVALWLSLPVDTCP